ncbi:DHA2 family efflux MFS transporter permease subunit [Solicola gregarius]|uniref:DHA2 family efflux MFS transporter permease subunit n=1 Tax=Solicola gregarius TaxID=2908642 RepID=A0AA46YLC4_9ACTN|nr:DHA2 family efflux MFS transporter permease subunit [Solicola gregarius]UYM06780.1 DHA2 family efflux MFS transporter permease subunit [Solicola gregarius]
MATNVDGHPVRTGPQLAALCLAQFMLVLDITVVNVALPTIEADLDLGRSALTWVVTAYTLCFGGLMLLGGRLADVLGARRVMTAGLVVFTLASLTAAGAPDAAWLITARAAQGVGAALVSPAALSILTSTHQGAARHRALAVWSALGGAGFAAGAIVGGALTSGPGWSWVFWINVPVGAALVLVLPFVVPTMGARARDRRVDLVGAALVTVATASVIYALVNAGEDGWADPVTLGALALGVVSYAIFARAERVVREPLMHVTMLRRRPVIAGSALMLVASALMVGTFFLGSLYLQHIRGYAPVRTGLLFVLPAIAVTAGAHLAGRLIGRIGPRPISVAGLGVAALGGLLLATVSEQTSVYASVLPGMTLVALGVGPVFVTATTTAMGYVRSDESGLASGLINTSHELGGAFGVAVLSTIAAPALATPAVGAFRDAYVACTIAAAVAAAAAVVLVPRGAPATAPGPHAH